MGGGSKTPLRGTQKAFFARIEKKLKKMGKFFTILSNYVYLC